jgi:hypothetical protein
MEDKPLSDGVVEFQAEVYKVQTLVDNGIRITLNLSETAIIEAAQLMECQRLGIYLDITAVAHAQNKEHETKTISRRAAKRRK